MPRSFLGNFLFAWLDNYDDVQIVAVRLLYAQILVGLIGSLGALYTGVITANLVVALFALIAIASGYQYLARVYAILLLAMVALDVAWFILFWPDIWYLQEPDPPFRGNERLSIMITFYAEGAGCCLRLASSLLWLQMYRLGLSSDDIHDNLNYSDFDYFNRSGYLLETGSPNMPRVRSSGSDFLGSAILQRGSSSTFLDVNRFPNYLSEEGSRGASPRSSQEQPHLHRQNGGSDWSIDGCGLSSHLQPIAVTSKKSSSTNSSA